jgi:hypothetical protein
LKKKAGGLSGATNKRETSDKLEHHTASPTTLTMIYKVEYVA